MIRTTVEIYATCDVPNHFAVIELQATSTDFPVIRELLEARGWQVTERNETRCPVHAQKGKK